jgi:hypothetical protein
MAAKIINYNGKRYTIKELAKEHGMKSNTLGMRLQRNNGDVSKALANPPSGDKHPRERYTRNAHCVSCAIERAAIIRTVKGESLREPAIAAMRAGVKYTAKDIADAIGAPVKNTRLALNDLAVKDRVWADRSNKQVLFSLPMDNNTTMTLLKGQWNASLGL